MGFKEAGEKIYEHIYDVVRRKSAVRRRINEFTQKSVSELLTSEQKRAVKEFYAPYKIPKLVFHNYFTEKTGEFYPEYIPIDLYVGYIDSYFNNIREAKYLDNKCYFSSIFYQIPQPITIAKRVNYIWFNGDNEVINFSDLKGVIESEEGVFLKEAQTSAGGHGVVFVGKSNSAMEQIQKAINYLPTDILIQRRIVQHNDMAAINPSSVNTLRIYSILGRNGDVTIYSSVLRTGVGDTKVDNFSSGGLSVGITEDGGLRKYGYSKLGNRVAVHPTTGLVFENYKIPSFTLAIELVRKAHPMIPHFRSVSWDIAINKDGSPILIEANLCRGGIDLLQLSNGPLYGKDTKKILDEVFSKFRNNL